MDHSVLYLNKYKISYHELHTYDLRVDRLVKRDTSTNANWKYCHLR